QSPPERDICISALYHLAGSPGPEQAYHRDYAVAKKNQHHRAKKFRQQSRPKSIIHGRGILSQSVNRSADARFARSQNTGLQYSPRGTEMVDLSAQETTAAEIRDLLSRINDAWLHKRGDVLTAALNACFAEDVVMRGPGFVLFGKGRDFAVQSYRDFVSQAEVKDFSLEEPDIDIAGETATATTSGR